MHVTSYFIWRRQQTICQWRRRVKVEQMEERGAWSTGDDLTFIWPIPVARLTGRNGAGWITRAEALTASGRLRCHVLLHSSRQDTSFPHVSRAARVRETREGRQAAWHGPSSRCYKVTADAIVLWESGATKVSKQMRTNICTTSAKRWMNNWEQIVGLFTADVSNLVLPLKTSLLLTSLYLTDPQALLFVFIQFWPNDLQPWPFKAVLRREVFPRGSLSLPCTCLSVYKFSAGGFLCFLYVFHLHVWLV